MDNDDPPLDLQGGSSSGQKKNDPKIQKLKEHVKDVQNVMQENINKILERGTRLDHLEDRSEILSSRADEFRVSSRRVSRKMWWQNMRLNVIIVLVIAAIALILYSKFSPFWSHALRSDPCCLLSF